MESENKEPTYPFPTEAGPTYPAPDDDSPPVPEPPRKSSHPGLFATVSVSAVIVLLVGLALAGRYLTPQLRTQTTQPLASPAPSASPSPTPSPTTPSPSPA